VKNFRGILRLSIDLSKVSVYLSRMLLRVFQILAWLPLPLMHAFGAAAGWLTYASSHAYRERMRLNLKQAGYFSALHQAIAESGKNLLELPFIWCGDSSRVLRSAKVKEWQIAQSAIDSGKGVIFLTPHLGCFEIIAQVIASRAPLTALYRPPRIAMLEPLLEKARQRDGLALAPANLSGVRTLLKTLRKGGAVGLLPDQVPGAGEGVWTKFFGKHAYTMTLPAKLAQMSGATIILSYAERLPFGKGYVVHFVPFERQLTGTPEEQAGIVNTAMEELIARCPSQYFWSYNRFKGQPPSIALSTDQAS
jgi:KDO2-lipid IV(A) lauroyltransferase